MHINYFQGKYKRSLFCFIPPPVMCSTTEIFQLTRRFFIFFGGGGGAAGGGVYVNCDQKICGKKLPTDSKITETSATLHLFFNIRDPYWDH